MLVMYTVDYHEYDNPLVVSACLENEHAIFFKKFLLIKDNILPRHIDEFAKIIIKQFNLDSKYFTKHEKVEYLSQNLLNDDKYISIRRKLAFNKKCDTVLLTALSSDIDHHVRYLVAENKKCPIDILKTLANDENELVRSKVVEVPRCPVGVLRSLSDDVSSRVRKKIAENKKCPIDILEKLSKDKNDYVREVVVRNKNCPPNVLESMYNDCIFVKLAIARNTNCPMHILKKLNKSEWPFLKEAVSHTISIKKQIDRSNHYHIMSTIY